MRDRLKQLLDLLCRCLMFPAALCFLVQSRISGRDAAFAGWSQLLCLLPGSAGVRLRRAFLRSAAHSCGQDVCVSFGSVFSSAHVSLGDHAYIGHFCSIGDVCIEADVLVASHVSLMNGLRQHGTNRLDIPVREQPGNYEPITIGRDSWIGEHATVAASVGKHCVVGAGALVLQPIPDFAIAVGVPARIIGDRRSSTAEPIPAATDTPALPASLQPAGSSSV